MVGEGAVGEPVPPVGDGRGELLLRLVDVGGAVAGPRQRDEGRLTLVQGRAAVAAGPDGAETDGRVHGEDGVADRGADRHGLVAVALVVPHPGLDPVLEDRDHVGHDLDVALDAGRQPQEGARRRGVARGAAVVRSPGPVGHGLDHQEVLDEQPSRRGVPGRLQHHGPGHVAPMVRHEGAGGTEAEVAGRAVQEGAEDARGVRPREAQPLDGAVRGDETAGLAVRDEPIVGDRWKDLCLSVCRGVFGHPPDARERGCRSQGPLVP